MPDDKLRRNGLSGYYEASGERVAGGRRTGSYSTLKSTCRVTNLVIIVQYAEIAYSQYQFIKERLMMVVSAVPIGKKKQEEKNGILASKKSCMQDNVSSGCSCSHMQAHGRLMHT